MQLQLFEAGLHVVCMWYASRCAGLLHARALHPCGLPLCRLLQLLAQPAAAALGRLTPRPHRLGRLHLGVQLCARRLHPHRRLPRRAPRRCQLALELLALRLLRSQRIERALELAVRGAPRLLLRTPLQHQL